MKPRNTPQAKQLIERYRSITLDEIENIINVFGLDFKAMLLTGYGTRNCIICNYKEFYCCDYCIFRTDRGCLNHKTYENIGKSKTNEQLLQAFRNRADYIENLLKQFE